MQLWKCPGAHRNKPIDQRHYASIPTSCHDLYETNACTISSNHGRAPRSALVRVIRLSITQHLARTLLYATTFTPAPRKTENKFSERTANEMLRPFIVPLQPTRRLAPLCDMYVGGGGKVFLSCRKYLYLRGRQGVALSELTGGTYR